MSIEATEPTITTGIAVHCCACGYDHFILRMTVQRASDVYEASATLNCARCGREAPGIHIKFQLTAEA